MSNLKIVLNNKNPWFLRIPYIWILYLFAKNVNKDVAYKVDLAATLQRMC